MKVQTLLAPFVLVVASLVATPARAVVDPCTVYTCMAGISGFGASGGPGCTPAIAVFHAIQVWSPYFNAPATANARRAYLMTCPGAQTTTNAGVLAVIINTWGYTP